MPTKANYLQSLCTMALLSRLMLTPRVATALSRWAPPSMVRSGAAAPHRRAFLSASHMLLAQDGGDLPYHIVVAMPALSPTMESGALSEWYVKEGDGINAGDAIAQIETDKASMDFEAQDDAFVAKILREPGPEIAVGTPIMVTVEEEEYVAAFKDMKPEDFLGEEAASSSSKEDEKKEEPPKEDAVAATAASGPAPKEAKPGPPPSPPSSAAAVPEKPAPASAAVAPPPASGAPEFSVPYGPAVNVKSPFIKTLSKSQHAYVQQYGTTGQVPL